MLCFLRSERITVNQSHRCLATPQNQANISDIHQPYQPSHSQQVYPLFPPVCCVSLVYILFFNALVWWICLIRVVNSAFDILLTHMPNIKLSFILLPGICKIKCCDLCYMDTSSSVNEQKGAELSKWPYNIERDTAL